MLKFYFVVIFCLTTTYGFTQKTKTRPSLDTIKGKTITNLNSKPKEDTVVVYRFRCGSSKLKTQNVLYIVNGKEVSSDFFSKLNPNDFLSVDVLKGAKATALYGDKAVNGVIIIQLKPKCGAVDLEFT